MNALRTMFLQSPLMAALFLLSILCGAVIFDRLMFWFASWCRYKPLPLQILQNDPANRRQMIEHLQKHKRRHYTQELLLSALLYPDHLESQTHIVSRQVDMMSAKLGMLDLIAKIAPLVGILGTVVGMAMSFGGIGALVDASPAAISTGISVALKTTAYGLVISITASVAAAAFRRIIRNATLNMERVYCDIQRFSTRRQ